MNTGPFPEVKRVCSDLPLFFIEVVTSTNTFMKEWSQEVTLENGTALYAGDQTSGRGRPGNQWIHVPGNLALSFWISGGAEEVFPWTLKSAFILLEFLSEMGLPSCLKYPNDVWLQDPPGKIAGILVEKVRNGFVIGIGVNRVAPSEIPKARGFERLPEMHRLAQELTSRFHRRFMDHPSDRIPLEQILERLNDLLLWKGRWVALKGPQGPSVGKIICLDPTGRLLLTASDGQRFLLHETVRALELVGESDES